MEVYFVDTSILVEILEVPGKAQAPNIIKRELHTKVESGATLLLPITAVIETGNHIAQIKGQNAHLRRGCATRFAGILDSVARGKAPFVPNELTWNPSFINGLVSGVTTKTPIVDLLDMGFGTGDLTVLAEADEYWQRAGAKTVSVNVWTLDDMLQSFS